jgi:outer membrane translocation and assembly module TamA
MRFYTIIFSLLLVLILGGCSNTRFLKDDQLLYTGQEKIEISIEQDDQNASALRKQLQSFAPQKPNNSMFDRRVLPPIGLWVYNYWKVDEQKKFRHWIYNTLSKPPVLVSDVNPELRARNMQSSLFDQGYFHAIVRSVVDTSARDSRKARVAYSIDPGMPYCYEKIEFDSLLETLDTIVSQDDFRHEVKTGEQFNLDKLSSARSRLTRQFQNHGYFYFNNDIIQLDADTTLGDRKLNLLVRSNSELPDAVLTKYWIDSIRVYISRSSDSAYFPAEPVVYKDIWLYASGDYLNPSVVSNALYFQSGDQYSITSYQNSLSRLNQLGVFSYVRISFEAGDGEGLHNLLNVRIDLLMADHINLNLEADLVMKSTGFVGPGVSAGISHNNTFRGAEKIQFSPTGAIEWQWGPKQKNQLGTFSYELGVNSSLTFPELLLPGNLKRIKRILNQETSVHLNFNILNRTQYYSMFSALSSLKYSWGKRREIMHSYSPLYLNSVSLLATTPSFDSVIDENIYIRKSFEEQFIVGMKYDFSFDNTYKAQAQNIYFQTGISTSGNALDLFAGFGKNKSERPYEFLNNVYSQHLKITTDFRYYLNGFNKVLAMRLYAGVGLPYLNSSVLPYVEQFFSGGAYSIRGFTARTLGPGSYHEQESSYIDQSGDMKLEANLEFRFGISRILKGAVFMETGNIWLINEDENRPGSNFDFSTFHNQLAVGSGVGLRFDFNFFVLRTDLGFPIRTPYLQNDKNWFSGDGKGLSNALFYFAIGYPF